MDENLRLKVVQELNEELGSNVDNLSKCHDIFKRLLEEKDAIEKKLSMASSAAPSRVNAAVRGVEEMSTLINDTVSNYDELSVQVQTQLSAVEPLASQLHSEVEKVQNLEQCLAYLLWIQDFETFSSQLEAAYQSKNERKAVVLLNQMNEKRNTLKSSACHHLVSFTTETVHYWHGLLKDKLSNEFDEVLKVLKWPFVTGAQVLAAPPSSETLQRFDLLIELLLRLELPESAAGQSLDSESGDGNTSATSALLVDFAPPPLPLQLMVSPLRKRFLYHFSGQRQTNRPDKPEWYMAQVLAWVRDHSEFVTKTVQPVLERVLGADNELDAQVEFTRALVQLVLEKLHAELPTLQRDDAHFAHALDETLSFDKELRSTHSYPIAQPGVVSVLTQAPVFLKWIAMEKKYASEHMDRMLNSVSAWQPLSQDIQDELKVTECAESFLTLLLTMTDRFRNLPQPGHRLQFLELQLELLDDFRVRLIQLTRSSRSECDDPLSSQVPAMLNTVNYIACVLREWRELPHFLQLQFYREQFESGGANSSGSQITLKGSVFDDALELLERFISDELEKIVDYTLMDVKARTREYRKDRWFAMSSGEGNIGSLTASACAMFRVLSSRLLQLQELLAQPLFTRAWQSLAEQLAQFVLEEVVLENWFSEGGAKQLHYDMLHGLFPLFGQFTSRPENHFKEVKEACAMLTLAAGSARLLHEALVTPNPSVEPSEALADIGVHRLTPQHALAVLVRRNDISADHETM